MIWSHSELENLTIHFEGKLYLDSNFIGIGVNLGIHKLNIKK